MGNVGKRGLIAAVVVTMVLGIVGIPEARAESDGYWDYRTASISGSYRPVVGWFGDDEAWDILWYGPGTLLDSIWFGNAGARGAGVMAHKALKVGGDYTWAVVGDFAGEEHDDVLWYKLGSDTHYLWINDGTGTFTSRTVKAGGGYVPYRLIDYNADDKPTAKDDVLFYSPSKAGSSWLWHFDDEGSSSFTSTKVATPAGGRVVIGDWDGNGYEDAFVHEPGPAQDKAFYFANGAAPEARTYTVNGSFSPTVIYDYPTDGILWWADGAGKEAYWRGGKTRQFRNTPVRSVDGSGRVTTYPLAAAVVSGPRVIDGLFIGTYEQGEFYTLTADSSHEWNGPQVPLVGDYDADGMYDVLWYGPGSAKDQLWYLEPASTASKRAPSPAPGVAARMEQAHRA